MSRGWNTGLVTMKHGYEDKIRICYDTDTETRYILKEQDATTWGYGDINMGVFLHVIYNEYQNS